jgi:hypothetical protein
MKKVWIEVFINVVVYPKTDVIRTSDAYEGEIDGGGSNNSGWEGELDWG